VQRALPRRRRGFSPRLAAAFLAGLAIACGALPAAAQEPLPAAGDEPLETLSRAAAAAQEPPGQEPGERVPFAAPQRPAAEMAVAATVTPDGPLFALEPLVQRLGGELTVGPAGGARQLVLDGRKVLFGPGNPVALVDGEPVRLSMAPVAAGLQIQVPLDFLRATYGEILGFRFTWDPAAGRLAIERRTARELAVGVDVVNLGGLTTVVLQFPEEPRYRIEQVPSGVVVRLLGDRLAPSAFRLSHRDPLVRDVRLHGDRVEIDLAAGAGYASYELASPFRVVFDVHRAPEAPPPTSLPGLRTDAQPPRAEPGIHTIVLDPGHGGGETGAIGPSGTEEKEITLLLARALKSRLERRLPVRVLLTRGEDAELPLDSRTALANQNKADLFISLHLNSERGRGARGAETYFLSLQASDARAARAAEIENLAAGEAATAAADPALDGTAEGDPLYDLQLILWDLAQSRHLADSQRLAALIQEELNGALGLRDRGVKQAPFRVLMGAAMPAVLVELGFISNPEEEERLRDAAYRAQLVEAVARAVERYRAQAEGLPEPDVQAASPGADGRESRR
jgi:N-acetylmuramoyl-L-alanine amidase